MPLAAVNGTGASTTANSLACSAQAFQKYGAKRFHTLAIIFVKAIWHRAIDIPDTNKPITVHQRHHYFRTRGGVASDVARKRVYIGHELCLALAGSCPTDSAAQWNTHASGFALKRPQHQLLTIVKIETGPIQLGQRVENQGTQVCGIRDAVVFARQKPTGLGDKFGIQPGFGVGGNGSGFKHSEDVTVPAVINAIDFRVLSLP